MAEHGSLSNPQQPGFRVAAVRVTNGAGTSLSHVNFASGWLINGVPWGAFTGAAYVWHCAVWQVARGGAGNTAFLHTLTHIVLWPLYAQGGESTDRLSLAVTREKCAKVG